LREFCAIVAQQKRNEFNAIKRLSTLFNLEPSTRWQKVLKRTTRTLEVNG
jgi:hypothetical protein